MFKIIYIKTIFIFLILSSCQSNQNYDDVIFDYSQFNSITFLVDSIEIQNNYSSTYEEKNIDYIMENSPSKRLIEWINNNVKGLGAENKLVIMINNASIESKKNESEIKLLGITKKKNEILYELKYEAKFNLYDNSNNLIGETEVKTTRSTTSSSNISLLERDRVLDNLVKNSLKDFADKANKTSIEFLGKYIF